MHFLRRLGAVGMKIIKNTIGKRAGIEKGRNEVDGLCYICA